MSQAGRLGEHVVELRDSFDRGFAAALPDAAPQHEDLLAIRCGEHRLALRLAEVRNLAKGRKIVPLPSPMPELLGLVAVRGVVTPVYDLQALLGYEPAPSPLWLALVRAPAPFAVAFATFERHLRVDAQAVLTAAGGAAAHPHARASVVDQGAPRPILDLLALFAATTDGSRLAREVKREDP